MTGSWNARDVTRSGTRLPGWMGSVSGAEATYWAVASACAFFSIATNDIVAMLATILLFGLPHGALDGEMARTLMFGRYGRVWFAVFALPYLALVAAVLLLFHAWPRATLSGFLAISLYHFGREACGSSSRLVRVFLFGAAPLLFPALLRPTETVSLLSAMIAPATLDAPPLWLVSLAPFWLACFALASFWGNDRLGRRDFTELAVIFLVFLAFPPLPGFMLYFVFIHASRHMHALVLDRCWPRLGSFGAILLHALPLTIGALLIGAAIWPEFAGERETRLIAVTFQLLAALTLPHVLFDALLSFRRMDEPGDARSQARPGIGNRTMPHAEQIPGEEMSGQIETMEPVFGRRL